MMAGNGPFQRQQGFQADIFIHRAQLQPALTRAHFIQQANRIDPDFVQHQLHTQAEIGQIFQPEQDKSVRRLGARRRQRTGR